MSAGSVRLKIVLYKLSKFLFCVNSSQFSLGITLPLSSKVLFGIKPKSSGSLIIFVSSFRLTSDKDLKYSLSAILALFFNVELGPISKFTKFVIWSIISPGGLFFCPIMLDKFSGFTFNFNFSPCVG